MSVNKCVQKILYNETNLQDIITYANSEPFQIPLVLHENLPNYFQNNLLNKDENNCDLSIQKLQSLSKYYDTMIDYCKLEKLIFKNQSWEFIEYSNILSSYNANIQFNKFPKTPYQKYTKIVFSTLLSKTSLRFLNLKNLKELCNKLEITTNDFQYYSELSYNHWF